MLRTADNQEVLSAESLMPVFAREREMEESKEFSLPSFDGVPLRRLLCKQSSIGCGKCAKTKRETRAACSFPDLQTSIAGRRLLSLSLRSISRDDFIIWKNSAECAREIAFDGWKSASDSRCRYGENLFLLFMAEPARSKHGKVINKFLMCVQLMCPPQEKKERIGDPIKMNSSSSTTHLM
jgi:hypothetical protein